MDKPKKQTGDRTWKQAKGLYPDGQIMVEKKIKRC